jgi:hypothetical protein
MLFAQQFEGNAIALLKVRAAAYRLPVRLTDTHSSFERGKMR